MFNVNGPEIVVLAVLFLLLFGPERLPEVVMQVARWIGRFRALTDQATAEIRKEFEFAAQEAEAAKREFEQLSREAKEAVDAVEGEAQRALTAAEGGKSDTDTDTEGGADTSTGSAPTGGAEPSTGDETTTDDKPADEPSIGGPRAAAAERDAINAEESA